MNRIVLVGRLESTPDLRHTSTGIPVANFSLSVRRSIPNGQGRYERDVFRVVTWRKLAETCCRFLERGRMIAVDGKLQNRILQSPNGDRRVIVEIHADDVRFLEGAKPRSDTQRPQEDVDERPSTDESSSTEERPSTEESTSTEEKPETVEVTVAEVSEPVAETASADTSQPANTQWFEDDSDGTPLDM